METIGCISNVLEAVKRKTEVKVIGDDILNS